MSLASIARSSCAGSAPVPVVNFLRALGSHLIVWHHLAFYGPISDVAYLTAPLVLDWLVDYARMAVQVFFVLGGFVTARRLQRPRRWSGRVLVKEIGNRYLRIGVPYLVALLVAVGANAIARRAMDHDSISAPPTAAQLAAHAFFLQDILDYEPLTAGIWYLAIDFQLGVLVLLVLATCQKVRGGDGVSDNDVGFRTAQWVFWPLAAASLCWLNRDAKFDTLAVYYFGSYFGGMVVAWVMSGRLPKSALWAYAALICAAVAVDWRPRVVVALATMLTIYLVQTPAPLRRWWTSSWIRYWSERSYSLFLIHFPVCLVLTAWLAEHVSERPRIALAVMLLQYTLSLAAAMLFYRLVESRILEQRQSRSLPSPGAVPAVLPADA